MATTPRSMPVTEAIGRGTIASRWNLIKEIVEIPPAASFENFSQQFKEDTKLRGHRNANRLLTQWTFNGWTPVLTGQAWDFKKSFIQNKHASFVSEAGLRFAALVQMIELSKTSPKFSDIFDECKRTVQKIRCYIYEERWRKYGPKWLSNQNINFQTHDDKQAFLIDLFRLMCFDFVVRRNSLTQEDICVISNAIQDPANYGINNLATFRTYVDSQSDDIRAGNLNVSIDEMWELGNSYHFYEFHPYKETYGIKLFSTVEGNFKHGFRFNGRQDCFTELLQRLEE
jgi:hypothetical protein